MRFRAALLFALAIPLAACAQGDSSPSTATAADPLAAPGAVNPQPVPAGDPRIALAAKIPGTRPEDLHATPVAGIYELAHGGEISYLSADGQYVFSGDLYQVTTDGEFPNLSETRRRTMRLEMLAALPEKDMIGFGDARAPHVITVFTDMDCQWCQHMHSEIAAYNQLGIRVRYLAYPRSGPDTESWEKAEAVWCAKDRQAALTDSKLGKTIKSAHCEAPVAREYKLGQQFGLTGTPGVVLPNGELLPGYLPPKSMLEAILEGAGTTASK
jgi:thiol:disulfide interchange protein DsbC